MMNDLRLRRARLDDMPVLERWDTDPDVIAATTDDEATARALGGPDWRVELGQHSDVSYYLIAEVEGRPVGAVQICDPRLARALLRDDPTDGAVHRVERLAKALHAGPNPSLHRAEGQLKSHCQLRLR